MKILRTIIWVLAAAAFLIFAIYNWQAVELTLWQNLVLETKVPVLVLLAFALGFVPLYAYHLSVKWALSRRVRTLENSLKHSAAVRQHAACRPGADDDVVGFLRCAQDVFSGSRRSPHPARRRPS